MMRRILLAILFPFLSTPVHAQRIDIVGTEFGLFDAGNPQAPVFQPTRLVPLVPGQRYGWVIELRTQQRSVSVREEYLLPNPATEAGPQGDLKNAAQLVIPLPRRSQVSQRQLVPVGGSIVGEWVVGPAEPPGRRHLQVIVEGQVAGSFEYEVR